MLWQSTLAFTNHVENTSVGSHRTISDGSSDSNLPRKLLPAEIEARRTFLGCYYLSSSVCLGLRKPSSLRYSDYVAECSQTLADAQDAESDYLLPYFIKLQRLAEEVNHAFDYDSQNELPLLDAVRIELLAKAFAQQLSHFEASFPAEVWNNAIITMSYYHLRIYVNEIGLHASPQSPLELMPGQSTRRAWYDSVARSESLIRCLEAAKDYLDRVLSLPSCEIRNFTIPEYQRLIYAVLVLANFTVDCEALNLGAAELRRTANLARYLDSLVRKLDELITINHGRELEDYIWLLRHLFQDYRAQLHSPSDYSIISCSTKIFMEVVPSSICQRITSSDAPERPQDESWTDMLEEWSSLDPSAISIGDFLE